MQQGMQQGMPMSIQGLPQGMPMSIQGLPPGMQFGGGKKKYKFNRDNFFFGKKI
jgi:hypothetical protein